MQLTKTINRINRIIRPTCNILQALGAGALALMMFLTAGDVTMRYIFNRPIVGAFDLTEYLMAILVSFGLAYCALNKGMVRVDLVVDKLPKRVQVLIDAITGFLSLGLFCLISWQCFVNVKEQYESGFTSTVLLIPVFPFAGLVGLGCAVLTLVLLLDFLEMISGAMRK